MQLRATAAELRLNELWIDRTRATAGAHCATGTDNSSEDLIRAFPSGGRRSIAGIPLCGIDDSRRPHEERTLSGSCHLYEEAPTSMRRPTLA